MSEQVDKLKARIEELESESLESRDSKKNSRKIEESIRKQDGFVQDQ